MALATAAFAEFTSKEMCTLKLIEIRLGLMFIVLVNFFDPERSHMKQELLEPEDEFSSIQTTNFIKIPMTILKAW